MAKNAQSFENRPWGTFEVLHEFRAGDPLEDIVIKKIVVFPGLRLSYQMHQKRYEHWHIISGEGYVIIDDVQRSVTKQDKIFVPISTKHRIGNNHSDQALIFIEITGGEFDEFDNTRIEDDYGR